MLSFDADSLAHFTHSLTTTTTCAGNCGGENSNPSHGGLLLDARRDGCGSGSGSSCDEASAERLLLVHPLCADRGKSKGAVQQQVLHVVVRGEMARARAGREERASLTLVLLPVPVAAS